MINTFNISVDFNSYSEAQAIIDNVGEYLDGYGKKLLYVGANCSRAFFLDFLTERMFLIDIMEIFDLNIECIKEKYKYNNLIHGDISDGSLISFYDVIFWYHGPEHVTEEQFEKINEILEKKTNIIILGCPYEDDSQGEVYGNIYEKHLWKITPKDLEKFGYKTYQHKRNNAVDNIIAWRAC